MDALSSASTMVFGTSGLAEVAVGIDAPSCVGGRSLDSGAVWVSGAVLGWGPDRPGPPLPVSVGAVPPSPSAAEVLSSDAVLSPPPLGVIRPRWRGSWLRRLTLHHLR